MDLKETLDEIEKLKSMAEECSIFAKKIEPFLPAGWEARFVIGWPGLLFRSGFYDEAKNAKQDFIKVCALVDQAGIKLTRKPLLEDESLFCLQGEGVYNPKYKFTRPIKIKVRQFNVSECKLEYKERTVRFAKLSEDCLNLGDNKAGQPDDLEN